MPPSLRGPGRSGCWSVQGSRATSDSLPAPTQDSASPTLNCSSIWRIWNDKQRHQHSEPAKKKTSAYLSANLQYPLLPSSKSTFSQPFKDQCISEVVRIGSIFILHPSVYSSFIIFILHLSKLWKAKFFILCDVIFLAKLQGGIWNW